MILWTIQPIEFWNNLQSAGFIRADLMRIHSELKEPIGYDSTFLPSYRWMSKQMHLRLRHEPSDGALPLWAWYQWQNSRENRPDLRNVRFRYPIGEKYVRIEFEIDDSDVLLSDFEQWHFVLNYSYLSETEQDWESFYERFEREGGRSIELSHMSDNDIPIRHARFHKELEESWNGIFEIDKPYDSDWSGLGAKSERGIQATFWELRLDKVRHVTFFTGHGRLSSEESANRK